MDLLLIFLFTRNKMLSILRYKLAGSRSKHCNMIIKAIIKPHIMGCLKCIKYDEQLIKIQEEQSYEICKILGSINTSSHTAAQVIKAYKHCGIKKLQNGFYGQLILNQSQISMHLVDMQYKQYTGNIVALQQTFSCTAVVLLVLRSRIELNSSSC